MVAVKTVVIADDTAFVRDRFRSALEGAGHRALTVRTGQELLATLRNPAQRVDLVVLDLRLPHSRGIDLVRSVRTAVPDGPPIVVFSGTIANAAEVRDLAALGVSGYVNEYSAVQNILPSLAPHLFPDNFNRRGSPRVVLGIPVAYRFGNTIAAALTLNLSKGGVAIRTMSPLDQHAKVRVRFRLPGSKVDVEADCRVAWSDRRVGMGLQFEKVESADQAAIDEFVDQIETKIFSVTQNRVSESAKPMREPTRAAMNVITKMMMKKGELTGISSGFKDLDQMMWGFQRQEMIVLAARPSMGKTSLALNFAERSHALPGSGADGHDDGVLGLPEADDDARILRRVGDDGIHIAHQRAAQAFTVAVVALPERVTVPEHSQSR